MRRYSSSPFFCAIALVLAAASSVEGAFDPLDGETPEQKDARWSLLPGAGSDFIETVVGGFAETRIDTESGIWSLNDAGLSHTTGWTLDLRFSVSSLNTSGQRAIGIALRQPGAGQVELQIRKDTLHLFGEGYGSLGMSSGGIAYDFSDGFHTLRASRSGSDLRVYVDNQTIPLVSTMFHGAQDFGGNRLLWGRLGADNAGRAVVDYLKLDHTRAIFDAPGNVKGSHTPPASPEKFALGWYVSALFDDRSENERMLDEMARRGFNLVRHADLANAVLAGDSNAIHFMDAAAARGIEVEVYLRPNLLSQTPQARSNLGFVIDQLADHPGLHAWHIGEEAEDPTFGGHVPLADFSSASEWIAQRDPDHPISAVFTGSGSSLYPPYLPYVDIAAIDDYPVRSSGNVPEQMRTTMKRMQALSAQADAEQKLWYVGQALQTGHFTLPTANQQRYLTFGALTVGAEGMGYFAWQHTTEQDRRDHLYPVTDLLADVIHLLSSGQDTPLVTSSSDASSRGDSLPDVTYLIRHLDGVVLVVAAAHASIAGEVEFVLDGVVIDGDDTMIEVIGEDRFLTMIPLGNGRWTFADEIGFQEVRLYRMSGTLVPEPTAFAAVQVGMILIALKRKRGQSC